MSSSHAMTSLNKNIWIPYHPLYIFPHEKRKHSVFQTVELPTLKHPPRVTEFPKYWDLVNLQRAVWDHKNPTLSIDFWEPFGRSEGELA